MKRFMFFEQEEGGMDVHDDIDGPEYFLARRLYGWMNENCADADSAMLDWMKTAEIGDYHFHRLGVLVRIRT